MTESAVSSASSEVADNRPAPPVALPDAQNPAIIDARKTFLITIISSALFIGAVVLFIL
jgi:hypothetical protein